MIKVLGKRTRDLKTTLWGNWLPVLIATTSTILLLDIGIKPSKRLKLIGQQDT